MSEWLERALKRLEDERERGTKSNQKAGVMAGPVSKALEEFCRQEEEFAQAVVQGGSFDACMKAVCQGVGGAISDLDAYKKAVQFYFPGAEVRFHMTVDLAGAAGEGAPREDKPAGAGLMLSFTDFL